MSTLEALCICECAGGSGSGSGRGNRQGIPERRRAECRVSSEIVRPGEVLGVASGR